METVPQRVGVIRSSDLPWLTIACRYSSQSECSPAMERKYATNASSASSPSLASSTSHVPSTCTHASSHSSERTTTETPGRCRAFLVFARCG